MRRPLLVVVAAACTSASGLLAPKPVAVPAVPSRGGPAWTELTSEHFTVWTDGPAEQGRALVRAMEQLREIVFAVSYFNEAVKTRSFVIALANVEEVHAYLPEHFIGHAWEAFNPLYQPIIVLPLDHLDHDRRIVTHELTHVISYNAIQRQPPWFGEGLATYFETVTFDAIDKTADVGIPSQARLAELRRSHPLPIAELFACKAPACMDDRFYDTAWAVFAYALYVHPDELMQYMRGLVERPGENDAVAWANAFRSLPLAQVDHELATWLAYGKVTVRQYPIAVRDWPIEQRAIGDGDVYAARGLLHFLMDPPGAEPAEIGQALAADPTNVVAASIRAARDGDIAPEVARQLTAAHPDDWRAWWLLVRALRHGQEAKDARDKTCELLAKNPAVLAKQVCATREPAARGP